MRRRDFITLLGGVAVWRPLTAGAQSAVSVIGLLGSSSSDKSVHMTRALRAGLNESGFIESKDVAIEYRWAHDNYDSFPALIADLVKRQVAGIVTIGAEQSALAAKVATNKIPIVFVIDGDPVSTGLVDSINRPGGNITGMSLMSSGSLAQSRHALVHRTCPLLGVKRTSRLSGVMSTFDPELTVEVRRMGCVSPPIDCPHHRISRLWLSTERVMATNATKVRTALTACEYPTAGAPPQRLPV
jgi:hypothetical protein